MAERAKACFEATWATLSSGDAAPYGTSAQGQHSTRLPCLPAPAQEQSAWQLQAGMPVERERNIFAMLRSGKSYFCDCACLNELASQEQSAWQLVARMLMEKESDIFLMLHSGKSHFAIGFAQ